MARLFNGSSDYIGLAPTAQLVKFTAAAWGKKLATGGMALVAECDSLGNYSNFALRIGSNSNFSYGSSGTSFISVTTPDITDNLWHLFSLTYNGAALVYAVDGVVINSTSAVQTPSSSAGKGLSIGRLGQYTGSQDWNGDIAEAGVWPYALDISQTHALAAGCPVALIPGNVLAMPLTGIDSPELDWSGNYNMGVLTGTSYADHPPQVRYPTRRRSALYAAPSGSFLPAWARGNNRAFGHGASSP